VSPHVQKALQIFGTLQNEINSILSIKELCTSTRTISYPNQYNMKVSCLFLTLSLAQAILANSPMNQLNIETIGRKLKDVIGADILKNRELLQQMVDLQKSEASQIYKYIDESMDKLSNDIFLTISEMKNNTETNLLNIKMTMKDNLENMNAKVKMNDQKIVESIIGQNGSALSLTEDWIRKSTEAIEVRKN
jgi:hypothetical protein